MIFFISGGLPGKKSEHQPYLYFAADGLEYQVDNKANPRYTSLTSVRVTSTSAELHNFLRQKLFLINDYGLLRIN